MEDLEWRKYRRRSARHRVEERIRELGLDGFATYLDLLRTDPEERGGLADLMRVTVSRFFRERECWITLAEEVLPELITAGKTVRAWCAGCCSGEEPYSLAMIWLERIAPRYPGFTIEIVASDIDEASLSRASEGLYDSGSLREVPQDILTRYFSRERGRWRIADEVRSAVRLEKRNLMSGPLPAGMDLALCRYLAFTYYRDERLLMAASRLRESIRPGGALMTGKNERLPDAASALFEPWPGSRCLYRRKG